MYAYITTFGYRTGDHIRQQVILQQVILFCSQAS